MSRVPAIRFKGFTDPWEQRKLGNFGEVAMCKRIYKDQTAENGDVPFFKIGTFGGEPDAFISEELFEDYRERFSFPKRGTLLVSAAGSIGRIVEYQGQKAYFQDSNIVWLEHGGNLDDGFLKQLYSKIKWGLEGSTIKRLYNKDILDAEVVIPEVTEQIQIGAFFLQLDHLITLHQRKYDKLCTVKKSMLDKMFPKPGEFVPEIRFEGFTDPWEQRKLGEVASLLGGNAWSSKEYDPSGDYLVITIANVTGEYEVDDSEGNRINVNGNSEYLLSHGDILVSLTGNVGRVSRMTSTKAVLNQRVGKLSVDCDIDDEFIFQAIRDGRFLTTMETASQGAAQKNISNSDVLSFELLLPTLKEQQVVGEALHRIDTLITLHQRKLELLKNIKKSLLDKMFV